MKYTSLFLLLGCQVLFITVKGQTITGDNINVNSQGTATSATNYSSGTISLTNSTWNSATNAPVPRTYTIKATGEPFATKLTFEVGSGSFGAPWSSHSIFFKGANMAHEIGNDNESISTRIMTSWNTSVFGISNYGGGTSGVVPPNDFLNFFGINASGKVGSLDYTAYHLGNPVFKNVLDDGNGNMGLGIASPSAQLHTTGSVRFAGVTNNNTAARIAAMDANGNLFYRDAATLGGAGSWSVSGSTIFNANTGLVMIGGSVNPNTADADLRLAVKGNVYAQKLKITAPVAWPDYVFAPLYQLPALQEIETFIRKNKHLPDVPSAAEVEKNGIDVGDNQAVLLKKIEELTLYVIQLNKKLDQQNKRISKQQDQLHAIQRLKRVGKVK